jgi:hypothetical protein
MAGIEAGISVGRFGPSDRLKAVDGWEKGTAGLAGNVEHRLNAQNGVQNYDPNVTANREPLRRGLFLVKWMRWPPFFEAEVVKIAKYLFEDCVKGVSGIPDNSLDKFEVTNGVVRQSTSYPGIYKEGGGSLSLKVPEFAGSPVRKMLDYWISGVSDRKTGVCHFYGKPYRGVQANKSGSFIYILLGPTARPEDIEFACMLHDCMPYGEKVSHLASQIGDAGSSEEFDIEFSGAYDRGPEIDALGKILVKGYALYGESFLNSALPAYIYSDVVSHKDNSATMAEMFSVAAADRMTEPAQTAYDQNAQGQRQTLRDGTVGELNVQDVVVGV